MSALNTVPEFIVRGQPHPFIPLTQFRQIHQLDSDFAIALFQPKDYKGLRTLRLNHPD